MVVSPPTLNTPCTILLVQIDNILSILPYLGDNYQYIGNYLATMCGFEPPYSNMSLHIAI